MYIYGCLCTSINVSMHIKITHLLKQERMKASKFNKSEIMKQA